MAVALAVAAIVMLGSVCAYPQAALAAEDDGSASVTADIVLVAPGGNGASPSSDGDASSAAGSRTRAASPVTGDAVTWLPFFIAAVAAAGVAVHARRRTGQKRGAHARTSHLFAAFLAVALVGSAAPVLPLVLQAQADGNDQIVIELQKEADGTLSGSATYSLVNDATYYRDLVKLTETANAGYSLSDGSLIITVAPVSDEFSYIESPDAVKGASLMHRIPGSAVSDEHALKLKVSAKAESLAAGRHAVGAATFDMVAPLYEGMTATLPDSAVGQPVVADVSGLPSEAANTLFYAWSASDDGETWGEVSGTAAALTPSAALAGKKLAVDVTCQNPAWFAVVPARGVSESPVAPVYTVTFDVQGHGQVPEAQTGLIAGSKVEKPADPSETDWVFNGWYKDAACVEAWDFDADMVEADMTLYAKWVAVEYMRVVFDANGGTGAMDAIDEVAGVPVTLTANAFTRTGYTFMGWNTEPDGSGASYADQATRSDFAPGGSEVTLYAQWQGQPVNYTVNHYKRLPDDGGYDATPADSGTYTGTAGAQTAAAAKNYASDGYVAKPFSQVTIEGDGSTVVDIYYDWMTYTVTYETWGQPVAKKKDEGVRHGAVVVAPASPVADTGDPKFIGWYADASFATPFDFNTPITADTVVYAKYYPEVTVKFENSLALDVVFPKTLNSTFTESEASGCTVPGYTITGFYSDSAFTAPLPSGFSFTVDSDKTVFAKLTPRTDTPYTVKHLQQSLTDTTAYVEVTADRETLSGTTGAATQASAKTYNGFTAQTVSQAAIVADGSTVVEIYYDRNTTTPYKVEHYKQNLGDANYTLVGADTANMTGTTGAATQAVVNAYAGYAAQPFNQVAIAGDGTTVVKIYYDLLTYQVAFDLNGHGGSTSPAAQIVKHGGVASQPTPDPAEATWVFDGWFDAATGGTQYSFATPVTANKTLYAHWSRQKFTVSFVIDTTRGATPSDQSVAYGSTASNPGDPSNNGYALVDWYEDSGYATVFDFATAIIKNTSVYGKIVPTYAVTYDANDGNNGNSVTGMPSAQTKIATVGLALGSATPTRNPDSQSRTVTYDANGGASTGAVNNQGTSSGSITYTFDSWNTDADGNGTAYDPGDTYSADAALALYAQWTPGGTPFNAVTLPSPTASSTATAKRFVGWYDAATGGTYIGKAGESYLPDGDITLYAHWATTVIHFDAKGTGSGGTNGYEGTGSMADQEVNPAAAYTIDACTFTAPDGTGLVGWNTKQDGSGRWVLPGENIAANDGLVTQGGEITLYAQWSHLAGKTAEDIRNDHSGNSYLGDVWVSPQYASVPSQFTRAVDKVMICRLIGIGEDEATAGGTDTLTFMSVRQLPGVKSASGFVWNSCALRTSMNSGNIYGMMPSSVAQNAIQVQKQSVLANGRDLTVSSDKFWALSLHEICGGYNDWVLDQEQYSLFKNAGIHIEKDGGNISRVIDSWCIFKGSIYTNSRNYSFASDGNDYSYWSYARTLSNGGTYGLNMVRDDANGEWIGGTSYRNGECNYSVRVCFCL